MAERTSAMMPGQYPAKTQGAGTHHVSIDRWRHFPPRVRAFMIQIPAGSSPAAPALLKRDQLPGEAHLPPGVLNLRGFFFHA